MAGWAALAIGYALSLVFSGSGSWRARALAVGFAGLGAVQLNGIATGAGDPLAPLAAINHRPEHAVEFKRIGSIGELDAVLASAAGKPVMLDFYADWCISCKEMKKYTFTDARIRARLDNMLLLQVDVTANSADDKELLKRFGLFGPVAAKDYFFDATGKELNHAMVVGFKPADQFLVSL